MTRRRLACCRTVAPPPADTLLRPRYHAPSSLPSSLPFTPCFLLIPILAHPRPDGTRIQTARAYPGRDATTCLFDVLGERGAHGLLHSEGHLMLALDFAQFVVLGAEEAWGLKRGLKRAWVFEGIAHAGHGQDLQAHVMAKTFRPTSWPPSCFLTPRRQRHRRQRRRRQRRRFPLARDGHKPLAGRRAANRRGLRRAVQEAMGDEQWATSFTSPILERMSRLPLATRTAFPRPA